MPNKFQEINKLEKYKNKWASTEKHILQANASHQNNYEKSFQTFQDTKSSLDQAFTNYRMNLFRKKQVINSDLVFNKLHLYQL